MVRPEMNLGDGDAVCPGDCGWGVQGSAGDDHGGNVGLGQHDWFVRAWGCLGSVNWFGAVVSWTSKRHVRWCSAVVPDPSCQRCPWRSRRTSQLHRLGRVGENMSRQLPDRA